MLPGDSEEQPVWISAELSCQGQETLCPFDLSLACSILKLLCRVCRCQCGGCYRGHAGEVDSLCVLGATEATNSHILHCLLLSEAD